MALVRQDGLILRDLQGHQLKTFIQNGVFHQFYVKGGSRVESVRLGVTTQFKDQYLIMPRSIFDIWSKE